MHKGGCDDAKKPLTSLFYGCYDASMSLEAITTAVKTKASEASAYRSEAARLRAVLPEVEAAISAGITHEAIVATLNEAGVKLEVTGFRSALARARKTGKSRQHREESSKQAPTPGQVDPGKQPSETTFGKFNIPNKPKFVHNPSSDDDILS